jgi:hypothetical protein
VVSDVEDDAFCYLDELEAKILSVGRDRLSPSTASSSCTIVRFQGLRLSPAKMFEHGIARAGYIEVPRDPLLGLEFLEHEMAHDPALWSRDRQTPLHLVPGIRLLSMTRRALTREPRREGSWPFQVDPDDITKIYFYDSEERRWHALDMGARASRGYATQ